MTTITPCLWFAHEAEDAANFYVSLVPDSRIEHVHKSPADNPSGKAGDVLMVAFTLRGRRFTALNGGTKAAPSHGVSFVLDCADQAEVDRFWNAFAEGGSPQRCGWITDRYGIVWQVVPAALPRLLGDPDRAKAQRVMQAMLGMVKLDIAALENA